MKSTLGLVSYSFLALFSLLNCSRSTESTSKVFDGLVNELQKSKMELETKLTQSPETAKPEEIDSAEKKAIESMVDVFKELKIKGLDLTKDNKATAADLHDNNTRLDELIEEFRILKNNFDENVKKISESITSIVKDRDTAGNTKAFEMLSNNELFPKISKTIESLVTSPDNANKPQFNEILVADMLMDVFQGKIDITDENIVQKLEESTKWEMWKIYIFGGATAVLALISIYLVYQITQKSGKNHTMDDLKMRSVTSIKDNATLRSQDDQI